MFDNTIFSTEEEIIGTWVNGNPIYRKTIKCGQLPNASTKRIAHKIINLDRVINLYGNAYRESTDTNISLPFVATTLTYNIQCFEENGNVVIQTKEDRTPFKESYITLEYTKKDDNWQLIFEDNFNSIDENNWKYRTGASNNNELVNWVQDSRCCYINENKNLVIKALKEDSWYYPLYPNKNYGKLYHYISSQLQTIHKKYFTYGRFEVRMKVPKLNGSWPAFWTLGENFEDLYWPECGEIDIMEHINTNDYYNSAIHYKSSQVSKSDDAKQHKQIAKGESGKELNQNLAEWHTYGMIWNENNIQFYMDNLDNIVNKITLPSDCINDAFRKPHFLILDLTLGGNYAKLTPNDSDMDKMEMEIDYVKVFSNVKGNKVRNDFITENGKKYFTDSNGNKLKNTTIFINKKKYILDKDGVVQ